MSAVQPKIFVGCGTLVAGKGGISAVSRMMLRAFAEEGILCKSVSLLDQPEYQIFERTPLVGKASQLLFAARAHAAAVSCQHMIYDHVGLARCTPNFSCLRRKYAVWIHGTEVLKNMTRARMAALQNANCVLVNSNFTLGKFEDKYFPLPNAHVCPLATEASYIAKKSVSTSHPPTVGILARIINDGFMKGHLDLVDEWLRIVSQIPNARLIIGGGGSGLQTLKNYVSQSSVSQHIEIWGRVDGVALEAFWDQTDVFAMPSRVEGFGLVYVEAMQRSKPIIASVHDAGNEVNVDGVTGFNINLDEKNALADGILKLLSNKSLRTEMGKAAYAHWRDNYQFPHFKSRFMDIVRNNILT